MEVHVRRELVTMKRGRAWLQRSVQSEETQQSRDLRERIYTHESRWSTDIQIKHVTQPRHAGQKGAPRRQGL